MYDLYKHLVVNQIFTCFLLQNSNTAEMALKYGIFFRKLNINFVHVTADCSVFIYNADVKHYFPEGLSQNMADANNS